MLIAACVAASRCARRLASATTLSAGVARAAAKHGRATLKPFDSCDRLRGYLPATCGDAALDRHTRRSSMMPSPARPPAATAPAPLRRDADQRAGGGRRRARPGQGSGSTLFVLAGDRLRAVDVSGAEPAVLDSIELPDGAGPELLRRGARAAARRRAPALVISRTYGASRRSRTLLTDLDVADPAAMRELATESVEGGYVSARLTGETARVVVAAYPEMPVAERGPRPRLDARRGHPRPGRRRATQPPQPDALRGRPPPGALLRAPRC